MRDRGEIECLEPETGNILWQDKFPRAGANFYSSPVILAGTLYAAREDGKIFAANVESGFRLISESKVEDHIIASPVAIDGLLFIRGEKNLYCFGE